jgi:SAM-dependent methyltransferase
METTEHQIDWDDSKVARLWNYYAHHRPFRDLYFSKIYGAYVLRRARLPRTEPLSVLDFGCGPGFMWDHISRARLPWLYTGLDFSSDSVEALRQRASGQQGFAGAIHATGLPSRLPSQHFDAVLLLEVVEHLTDERLDSTISEVQRLLKPGGMLIVTTPHNEDLELESRLCPECGAVFHQWQHVRTWTADALKLRMCRHGFTTRRTWIGHWDDHHLPGWLFNRFNRLVQRKRTDVHMQAAFVAPPAAREPAT